MNYEGGRMRREALRRAEECKDASKVAAREPFYATQQSPINKERKDVPIIQGIDAAFLIRISDFRSRG